MLYANFKAYNNYITDSLYQWDKDQDLIINGLNLTVAPEIHFANANMDKAIVRQSVLENNVVTARIPNSLLQEALTIKAYVGVYEGTTFNVIETIEIPVIAKARPSDYSLTDTDEEIYSFNKLENEIANLIANANAGDKYSELVDIRVGFNGKIYNSAGQAVRSQIETVNRQIQDVNNQVKMEIRNIDDQVQRLNEGGLLLKDDVIGENVEAWLNEHPEATTTVQDASLGVEKLTDEAKLHLVKDYVTPQMYGAKGDGETDDTEAIKQAIASGLPVFIPKGNYIVTETIEIATPITITGVLDSESTNNSTLIKSFDGDLIFINSRYVTLNSIHLTNAYDGDTGNGLVIGGERQAQAFNSNNVLITNMGGDGCVLVNANNCTITGMCLIRNDGNGFYLKGNESANYSGNNIELINVYGNGKCGVILKGEANVVYCVSQSNADDNLKLLSWCSGCDITAYTEFSTNGYELNIAGNVFNNVIKGVFRSKTDKQFTNTYNMQNMLLFSQTNNNDTDIDCTPFLPNLATNKLFFASVSRNIRSILSLIDGKLYLDDKELMYERDSFNCSCEVTNKGAGGTVTMNNNGVESFCSFVDGKIKKVKYSLKEEITADILNISIKRDDGGVGSIIIKSNSGKCGVIELNNPLSVTKGQEITIDCTFYNGLTPANNIVSITPVIE